MKSRLNKLLASPLIDTHFHGAFGVDLMDPRIYMPGNTRLKILCGRLFKSGIHGFFPTTLSAPIQTLLPVVAGMGRWIHTAPGGAHAKPIGIHLEGPFLAESFRGAHPKSAVVRFELKKLNALFEASLGTIKIVTMAPELLTIQQLKQLHKWSQSTQVILSMGHSQANLQEAQRAIQFGFKRVTHLFNAMPFHHRAPGIAGAAIGNKEITLEVIPDGIHVSFEVLNWALKVHPGPIDFVSDSTPAVGCPYKKFVSFSDLLVTVLKKGDASRTHDGCLAGGGTLLPEMLNKLKTFSK